MSIWSAVTAIFTPITSIVESINGSSVEKEKIKAEIDKVQCEVFSKILELEKDSIEANKALALADAAGKSWLQRCWRPITMLTLLFLCVSDQLGILPNPLTSQAWSLIQLALGAGIAGRSAEKISTPISHAISKNRVNK